MWKVICNIGIFFIFLYYVSNVNMQIFFGCDSMSVSVTSKLVPSHKHSLHLHTFDSGELFSVCAEFFSPPYPQLNVFYIWVYFSVSVSYDQVWQGVIEPPGPCAAVATFREDSLGHFMLLVPTAGTEDWGFWIVNVCTLWQVLEIERKDTVVG